MTRLVTRLVTRLATEILLLLLGIELIVVAPDLALTILVVALPTVLVGAWVSIAYLERIYRRQTPPRSRFFGMLLGVMARKELLAVWLAYLVIGRIGERTGWLSIPVPPPEISSPITGLVVLVAFATPILYAVAVWRVRRAAGRGDLVDLERDV